MIKKRIKSKQQGGMSLPYNPVFKGAGWYQDVANKIFPN